MKEEICKNCLKLFERISAEDEQICMGNREDQIRICIKGGGIWFAFELDEEDSRELGLALLGASGLIHYHTKEGGR